MSLNPAEPFPCYESLSLVHPKLINWDTTKPHHLLHFDTNCEVFIYLNMIKPSHQWIKKEEHIVRSGINHLSHTRIGKASHNHSEHQQVIANLDKKKWKQTKVTHSKVKTQLWHPWMRWLIPYLNILRSDSILIELI